MNERDELLTRLTAAYADKAALSEEIISLALQAQSCDYPVIAVKGNTITAAMGSFVSLMDYTERLAAYFVEYDLNPAIKSFGKITEQKDVAEFDRKDVYVTEYTFNEGADIAEIAANIQQLFWSGNSDVIGEYLVKPGVITFAQGNLLRAAAEFLHAQFSYIDRSAYNRSDIYRYLALNADISADLVKFFCGKFAPAAKFDAAASDALADKIASDIENLNSGVYYNDCIAKNILNGALNFMQMIYKSNFFCSDKAALSFRLNPAFMQFFEMISPAYAASFPADRPFGVFYFFRGDAVGFQVRFAEIGRGGWRTVVPKRSAHKLDEMALFDAANDEIFREGYVLAHTQHLKNKDIYEGGSKMIMLLNMEPGADFRPTLWTAQRAVCEAFVSLINYDENDQLKDKNIVDYLGYREIIEIGPDENMFDDMITWMGDYAAKVGYTLGAGLISGKPESGINHKEYGVTSFGVYPTKSGTQNI